MRIYNLKLNQEPLKKHSYHSLVIPNIGLLWGERVRKSLLNQIETPSSGLLMLGLDSLTLSNTHLLLDKDHLNIRCSISLRTM